MEPYYLQTKKIPIYAGKAHSSIKEVGYKIMQFKLAKSDDCLLEREKEIKRVIFN